MPEADCTTSQQVQDFLDKNGGRAVVDCHATYFYGYIKMVWTLQGHCSLCSPNVLKNWYPPY